MNLSTFGIFKDISLKEGLIEIKGENLIATQQVLLGMMSDIDSVCRKNGISYFLSGGSMLGAIRHKGFIPWDDDIDIFLTRREFNKFKVVFEKELGEKYWLHTPGETHDCAAVYPQIRKKGTIYRCHHDSEESDQNGILIDIFVLENTFDNKLMRRLHCFLSMTFGFVFSCRRFYSRRKLYLYLMSDDAEQIKVCKIKIAIGFLFSFLSLDTWARLTEKVYSICKNDNSKLVVCPSGRKHFTGETYPRDPFCKTMEADFEGHKFLISQWYDGYLKQLYGDYMRIPPESERETHVVLEFDLGDEYKAKANYGNANPRGVRGGGDAAF